MIFRIKYHTIFFGKGQEAGAKKGVKSGRKGKTKPRTQVTCVRGRDYPIISSVPAVIRAAPRMALGVAGSFNRRKAKSRVMTMLSLSMGAT